MATPRKTHCYFTVALKLKGVETAEKTSKSAAAKMFDVDPKRIREWCTQKSQLVQKTKCGESRKKCLDGGTWPTIFPAFSTATAYLSYWLSSSVSTDKVSVRKGVQIVL